MDIKKLEDAMEVRGVSINDLARRTGIERSALYRRFKSGGEKITVEEAKKITEALSLEHETAVSIFFAAPVS